MNNITVIGIDLAKNIFQVHAEDKLGNKVFNKKMGRVKLKRFLATLPPCFIGMEACGTAHYWARLCLQQGHRVKLIPPRKVKAFLDGNKNDAKDAEAICEAAQRQRILGVPVKTLTQQDLTSLHKARSQLVSRRTQLANQLRSLLAEYGVITRQGHTSLMHLVEEVLKGEQLELSQELSFVLLDLYDELKKLKQRLVVYDGELKRIARENKTVNRLLALPGIGVVTATALVAKIEDFSHFRHGRDFGAWLGLVPKEHSSAGKKRLGRITKRGDRYLRTLLIHGARSEIQACLRKKKTNTVYHEWIQRIVQRRGKNIATVALANKHARIIWAMVRYDRPLELNFAASFQAKAA